MTPSERRLHPLSFLFDFVAATRSFLIPGLLVLFTAQTGMWANWQLWGMVGVVPVVFGSIFKWITFRYRYEKDEIVVRSGLFFRNERHIPYARIQNIDAIQNLLHRLFRVAEVRVETGGGQEPEARMRVLPIDAFEEMRRRVFDEKQRAAAVAGDAAAAASEPALEDAQTLLRIPFRELLLHGFVENRGMVVIGAVLVLLWESGLLNSVSDRIFGAGAFGSGFFREAARIVFGGASVSPEKVALTLGAFAAFLLIVRLVSMGWSAVRLHGFTLTLAGGDLRTRFGLLTRVSATVPLRRIQTMTIREGPLHRLVARVSVRVDTAGGTGVEDAVVQRQWLAPIVRRSDLPALLTGILPGVDLGSASWQPAPARAFRREFKKAALLALVLVLACAAILKWWSLVLAAILMLWAYSYARAFVARLGHTLLDDSVAFKSGWLWRSITIARFSKIQVVTLRESPFDRRNAMASVAVDTAGAKDLSHRVCIPYLAIADAIEIHRHLAREAAQTSFRW